MKVSAGMKEGGIVVGNAYDKYGSKNPIVRTIMKGFDRSLEGFVRQVNPSSIHEVGCGEGYWTLKWRAEGRVARGTDFSQKVIELARANAARDGISPELFDIRSIYDLSSPEDEADLVVCCEVLEHLDDPAAGLSALRSVVGRHLIVSVPREPIWRALNMARGKYISSFGNTPGHVQHWSKAGFLKLVSKYFRVLDVKSPLPWTMLLCAPRS